MSTPTFQPPRHVSRSATLRPAAILLALAGVIAAGPTLADAQESPPVYRDTQRSFDERTRDLISRMTLEEKAQALNHRGTPVERLGIRPDHWNQCLHGVCWDRPTTMFPVSIAMGATWNPELVRRVATAISDEARAVNNLCLDDPDFRGQRKGLIYRAPVINIERNPYWGRNEEAYGEDPHHTGRMGVAYVKGLQGDDPRYLKLVSTLKHYAVNNVENGRQSLSAEVSERMLHEYWLPHFRDCIVEGGAQSVMASYNAINGTPNNINHLLLTDILKDRWGFEGFVVSDLGGVQSMVRGHAGGEMTYVDAVAQSLNAGCDFSDREFERYIPDAVRQGLVPEERLNDALYRVLYNRMRLGEFDPPEMVPYRQISRDVICSAEHRALALEAAREAMVLLTNKDDLLPLDAGELNTIAVIGPHADRFTSGNYSGRADRPVTPLDGVRNQAAASTEVTHAAGCAITDRVSRNIDRENGFSRGQSVKLNSSSPGDYIEFDVDVPRPGDYTIQLRYKAFPSRGVFQLSVDGVDQGEPIDMYAPRTDYDRTVELGETSFAEGGEHVFRFTVVDQNDRSNGATGHFDRLSLRGLEEQTLELERAERRSGAGDRSASIAEAADLAGQADVAIVYVGTDNSIEREGRDRRSLRLPGEQLELVQAVVEANPKTVVVMMNAGPLTEPWIKENAAAVIEAWWHGVEGGNAVAEVLFGEVNPAGRLPHTVYASEDQVPPIDEYDVSQGFTYMYVRGEPLYAFGHGLSYTDFEYGELKLSESQIAPDGRLTVSVDVTNTGERPGDEVVQIYVRDRECKVKRPDKELRGFQRVRLAPGETKTVSLPLRGDQLAYWDEVDRHDFVVEPGEFEVLVGGSSQDIRTRESFEVVDP